VKILFLVFFVLVSACVSTQKVADKIGYRYIGQNLDLFVRENGIPYSKYQMSGGGYIYAWNSGVVALKMPATTSFSGNVSSTGYVNGTATTTGGGTWNLYCEIRIQTDRNNTVNSITIINDTWGRWTTSRCHEVFK